MHSQMVRRKLCITTTWYQIQTIKLYKEAENVWPVMHSLMLCLPRFRKSDSVKMYSSLE